MPHTLNKRGLARKMHREYAEKIGGYIKRFREDSKMSLAEMADEMGIDPSTQWRREKGLAPFAAQELLAYAKALDCQPADLLP